MNVQDSDGKTVLHKAVEYKHRELVEYLLNEFPSLQNVRDHKGNLPIIE